MKRSRIQRAILIPAIVLCLVAASPTFAESITKAIKDGKAVFDIQYRYEHVDQDGFDRNAIAQTIRLRLGYKTASFHNFFAFAGLEANEALSSESYNSTANGKTQFPVIADPQDAELNQAYLGWTGWKGTTITAGRQRLGLDNHRFVGNVGWRQLEQTFDSVAVKSKFTEKTNFFYSHVNNVNTIFGQHNPDQSRAVVSTSTDLVNFSYDTKVGKIIAYTYLLDFKDAPDNSQANFGLRFTGKAPLGDSTKLSYTAEYADQSDYKDAPSTVDADYMLGEVGLIAKRITAKVGYEVLSGDGTYAFLTPLATLHAFNGWADKFLATPVDGLEDTYLHLGTNFGSWKLAAIYHDFAADNGGADYGTEFDAVLSKTFKKTYTVGVKYAAYDADTFATDTDKFWFWLKAKI
jgi:hypothetical protein